MGTAYDSFIWMMRVDFHREIWRHEAEENRWSTQHRGDEAFAGSSFVLRSAELTLTYPSEFELL